VSGYTVDPQGLHSTAPLYGHTADQVAQIYRTLTDVLDLEGACWGSDEQGMAFGRKYVAAALPALSQLSHTNEGLQSMVDGVATWAKNYLRAEDAAQQSAAQVVPPDGG
jgi:hypothetical protein